MTERRIVSIWFPQLAMDRWRKAHADTDDSAPFALAFEGAHGTILDAINRAAREGGIRARQKLTDARAICPELQIEPADHEGDAAWLARLALWARRWCPWTAVEGDNGLLLDTTGGAHLHGGEAVMLANMRDRFAVAGLETRIALAPTIGAAWALSHFSKSDVIRCASGDIVARLAPFPVESLRIDEATVLLLRRLGLKTIGALADIPRLSLVRRFRKTEGPHANPLHRLDQALGTIEEVVAPLEQEPPQRALKRVAEPILHVALLMPILSELAERLCLSLEKRQHGLRRVRFELFRIDGHVSTLEAETARPVRDPAHIAKLFDEKFDDLDAGFGFDAFALTAIWHEAKQVHQVNLDEGKQDGIAVAHLIDRLCARIGAQNIRRPAPYASHIPERSVRWQPVLQSATPDEIAPLPNERPLRLFDYPEPITVIYATPEGPPKRFRWRRQLHDVVKLEGPERIGPEWWRERSTVRLRDYYKIEDEIGRRFWIYRSGVVGDGRGGLPDWFLHGLFA